MAGRDHTNIRIEDALQGLFERFDDIKDIGRLTDDQMLQKVKYVVGSDLMDAYKEWISQGEEASNES